MGDRMGKPTWLDLFSSLPGVMIVVTVIGGGAVALKTISDLAVRIDGMSHSIDAVNQTIAGLPLQDRRLSELEQKARDATTHAIDQDRWFNQLKSDFTVDHVTLDRLDKAWGAMQDQTNQRLRGVVRP